MEKTLVSTKVEIKQEVEEVPTQSDQCFINSNFDIKTEGPDPESDEELRELTNPRVVYSSSKNSKGLMGHTKEVKRAVDKQISAQQKPKEKPGRVPRMVLSNASPAPRSVKQKANKMKHSNAQASKGESLRAKQSIELVLIEEQYPKGNNIDKSYMVKHEVKDDKIVNDCNLRISNSKPSFGLLEPINPRKRKSKLDDSPVKEKKLRQIKTIPKDPKNKISNRAKPHTKQKIDQLNNPKKGSNKTVTAKSQKKNLQDRQNNYTAESISKNSSVSAEGDKNKLDDSESKKSVNLLERINHIKVKRKSKVIIKKKSGQTKKVIKNSTDKAKNKNKAKRNIEKIDKSSNETSNSNRLQKNTSKKQKSKASEDANINNNNTANIENDDHKNKSDNSKCEELDGFQEVFGVVQRRKRKYTPRQKPELTEEQKAENERQKLEKRTCTHCGRVFAFPGILQSHIRSKHTFEKPYSCEFCNDQFSRRSSYVAHRRLHLNLKPHLCNVCGKTFLRKASLHLHMQIHIPSEDKIRDVKCEFCPNVYTSKLNLTKHVLTKHTDPSKWKHECGICHKKCFSATDLTHHMRRHNDDRKYKCVICGRGFFTKQTMDVHVRTHSASTAFNCEHCPNGYRSNEALQRHMLKVHGIGEEKPVSIPTHFCPICNEGFRQRAGLEKHLIFHETGEEEYPFECQKCNKRYKARNYFTIHMLDKHKVFIDDAYFKAYFNASNLKNCTDLDAADDISD